MAKAKCEHLNEDGTFDGGFDGCVLHMTSDCGGNHSEESAKKLCGKIAQEKKLSDAPDPRLSGEAGVTNPVINPVINPLLADAEQRSQSNTVGTTFGSSQVGGVREVIFDSVPTTAPRMQRFQCS